MGTIEQYRDACVRYFEVRETEPYDAAAAFDARAAARKARKECSGGGTRAERLALTTAIVTSLIDKMACPPAAVVHQITPIAEDAQIIADAVLAALEESDNKVASYSPATGVARSVPDAYIRAAVELAEAEVATIGVMTADDCREAARTHEISDCMRRYWIAEASSFIEARENRGASSDHGTNESEIVAGTAPQWAVAGNQFRCPKCHDLVSFISQTAHEHKCWNTPGDGSAGASQSAHTPPARSSPVGARDVQADHQPTPSVDRQSRDDNAQVVRLTGERLSDPAPLSRGPLTDAEAAWLEFVDGFTLNGVAERLAAELRARRDDPVHALEEKYRDACVAYTERFLFESYPDKTLFPLADAVRAAKCALDQAKEARRG